MLKPALIITVSSLAGLGAAELRSRASQPARPDQSQSLDAVQPQPEVTCSGGEADPLEAHLTPHSVEVLAGDVESMQLQAEILSPDDAGGRTALELEVRSIDGRRVLRHLPGPRQLDEHGRATLQVLLPLLPDGLYHARLTALTAVEGDVSAGAEDQIYLQVEGHQIAVLDFNDWASLPETSRPDEERSR